MSHSNNVDILILNNHSKTMKNAVAEKAFVRYENYQGIQFVKRLKVRAPTQSLVIMIHDFILNSYDVNYCNQYSRLQKNKNHFVRKKVLGEQAKQKAEVCSYFQRFEEAENLYREVDCFLRYKYFKLLNEMKSL